MLIPSSGPVKRSSLCCPTLGRAGVAAFCHDSLQPMVICERLFNKYKYRLRFILKKSDRALYILMLKSSVEVIPLYLGLDDLAE